MSAETRLKPPPLKTGMRVVLGELLTRVIDIVCLS
jgi:hypothetical protein